MGECEGVVPECGTCPACYEVEAISGRARIAERDAEIERLRDYNQAQTKLAVARGEEIRDLAAELERVKGEG